MGGRADDGDRYMIPRDRRYQPPLVHIGTVLWTLAIASIVTVVLVADPGQVSTQWRSGVVALGRAFVGVLVFAVLFPLVFQLRQGSGSGS